MTEVNRVHEAQHLTQQISTPRSTPTCTTKGKEQSARKSNKTARKSITTISRSTDGPSVNHENSAAIATIHHPSPLPRRIESTTPTTKRATELKRNSPANVRPKEVANSFPGARTSSNGRSLHPLPAVSNRPRLDLNFRNVNRRRHQNSTGKRFALPGGLNYPVNVNLNFSLEKRCVPFGLKQQE